MLSCDEVLCICMAHCVHLPYKVSRVTKIARFPGKEKKGQPDQDKNQKELYY